MTTATDILSEKKVTISNPNDLTMLELAEEYILSCPTSEVGLHSIVPSLIYI